MKPCILTLTTCFESFPLTDIKNIQFYHLLMEVRFYFGYLFYIGLR